VWGARMNADIAEFVLDMFYMIYGDNPKRKGDVRAGLKVG